MAKKILHLIETLGHGGAEHQLALAVTGLNRQKYESTVCHLYEPSHLRDPITDAGIEVIGLGLRRSKKNWPVAVQRLAQIVRKRDVDLIHTSLFEADLLGGLVGLVTGVPVIGTLCNIGGESVRLEDNPHLGAMKLHVSTKIWSIALRHLHRHSIAISHAVRDSAVRTFGLDASADRATVIYRAIHREPPNITKDAVEALRRELNITNETPILLHVGRLAPQKGQRYLLAAMPAVLRHNPRARLLIVGEGWLRPTLVEQIKALGIESSVSLLGRREDVAALHQVSDIFVFPSLFEGLGVSLLEAANAGLACVTSNVGPLPEILEHEKSGLLVPAKDPSALADSIIALISDDLLRRRLGERAKESVREKFSRAAMISGMEDLYDRLLGPQRATDGRARLADISETKHSLPPG